MKRFWLLLLLAAGAVSCAPTYAAGYKSALDAGLRAKNAGRLEEAAAFFDQAADLGARYKDRDEARLLQADALEKMGRLDEAEASFRKVEQESGGRYHGVRAAFAIGRLVLKHRGFEEGEKETLRAVRAHPESGLVRHAIRRLLSEVETKQGSAFALEWLAPIERELHDTEAGEAISYEYGTLLARCNRPKEAVDFLLRLARAHPYPHGSLTDDAFYQASLSLEELGHPQQAIDVLQEMVLPHEAAYTGASYRRPRWPQGALRVARLYRDKIKNHELAKREFWRVYEEHFTSRETDDALWEAARMAHDDNIEQEACQTLDVLKEKKPDSRYLNCLHLLCPGHARGPRGCSNAIMLDLGKDPDSEWDERSIMQ